MVIVDTPGLYNTEMTEDEINSELAKIIGITAPAVHCFILVVRLGRFTKQDKVSFEKLEKFFGAEMYERTILLFTALDDLDKGMTVQDYATAHVNKELKNFIRKCRPNVVGFENHADGPVRKFQVNDLMEQIEDAVANTKPAKINKNIAPVISEEEKKQRQLGPGKDEQMLRGAIRKAIENEEEIYSKLLSALGYKPVAKASHDEMEVSQEEGIKQLGKRVTRNEERLDILEKNKK